MSDKSNPDSPQQASAEQQQASAEQRQASAQQNAPAASALELSQALDELIAGQPNAADSSSSDGRGEGPLKSSPGRCPQRAAWSLLLSGEAQPMEADELLTHAADCADCAKLLRSLTADPTAAEISTISTFSSSTGVWQKQLALRLAETKHRPASESKGRISPKYLWSGAAMAATLLLAVGVFLGWRMMNNPERLMAKAYSQSRIYEFRVPGAAFASVTPQVHLRGGATGRDSAPLLDARAHIERELEATPDDPHWLQLEARADILEENFDPAIDILDRLVARGPVTASLLADDATAYYQRGITTGSENDRATALEYLRRADELTPGDPIVLFNEALAMEDRAQVMNAVETWNRYLRFERDPQWLAEGRRHLESLEQKLNQLKSHQSRVDHYLATPEGRRELAANPAQLAKLDEELANYELPKILKSAFPLPGDRSRGSPCDDDCLSSRTLIYALAASLEHNHQDSWLTQLLPPPDSTPQPAFIRAAHLLATAVWEDVAGDFLSGKMHAAQAVQAFSALHNPSGEERSRVELSYAYDRSSDNAGCYREVHPVLGHNPRFVWPMLFALTQDHRCDSSPNSVPENDPVYWHIAELAHKYHYLLVELRARNMIGSAEVNAGNTEAAWRVYLPVVHEFYAADLPAARIYNTLGGLQTAEALTPRTRTPYLLQRESLWAATLTHSVALVPAERYKLAAAAIRAGQIPEGKEQMRIALAELAANGNEKSLPRYLTDDDLIMAESYIEHGDLPAATEALNRVRQRMEGGHNGYYQRIYAVEWGQLELTLGHPELVEETLRDALFSEESLAGTLGSTAMSQAMVDRSLYAVLAGVWQAQGRSGEDILALWERYRMRILGIPVPICRDRGFICEKPTLMKALARLGQDQLYGQILLNDRLLIYRANQGGVSWTKIPVLSSDVLGAVDSLERSVTSPATSLAEIDRVAQKAGSLFLGPLAAPTTPAASNQPGSTTQPQELLLEPDPMLGNLPWPSVEVASGPIGLHFNLAESPSLLLYASEPLASISTHGSKPALSDGKPLIVGASVAANQSQVLPEVMEEARTVATFSSSPNLLLGPEATEANVVARLPNAAAIHFAGHAAQELGATRLLLARSTFDASPSSHESAEDRPASMPKSWLDSDLIRSHPPRSARLAVFSACSTGKKEASWNHGMGDIVSALASVGVADVVSTRWQIDSTSALPLMDSFYKGLAAGQTVPQALTSARNDLMRNPRYRHPYYWAAWYTSGRGNTTLTQIFHERQ